MEEPSVVAPFNSACQALEVTDLAAKHQHLLKAMEVDGLERKFYDSDANVEVTHPSFQFTRDYMKFVEWIWIFIYATRVNDGHLHLESLTALSTYYCTRPSELCPNGSFVFCTNETSRKN